MTWGIILFEWGCNSMNFTNLYFYVVVVIMLTTLSKSIREDNVVNFEEVAISVTSKSSEVRELRTQLAALTDLVAQQAVAAQ